MASDTTPLVKKDAPQEKLAFPLGLVGPKVRPYLELIRLHKVRIVLSLPHLYALLPK